MTFCGTGGFVTRQIAAALLAEDLSDDAKLKQVGFILYKNGHLTEKQYKATLPKPKQSAFSMKTLLVGILAVLLALALGSLV